MGYLQLDDRGEIKLKYTGEPYVFHVDPGTHAIALNTLSPFRRSLSGGSRDGLTVATSLLTNATEDSWQGTVTLDADDVLFVYCESKFKSQFHLKVIPESALADTLAQTAAGVGKPRKSKKWLWILLALIAGGALAYTLLMNFVSNRPVMRAGVSDTANTVVTEKAPVAASDEKQETPVEDTAAPAAEKYFVSTEAGLKLRANPSTDSDMIVVMPYQAVIEVYEIKDGWARVKYEDKTGYCSAEYITKETAGGSVSRQDLVGTWYCAKTGDIQKYTFRADGTVLWTWGGFEAIDSGGNIDFYLGCYWNPAAGETRDGTWKLSGDLLLLDVEDGHVGHVNEEIKVGLENGVLKMQTVKFVSENSAASSVEYRVDSFKKFTPGEWMTADLTDNTVNTYTYTLEGNGTFEFMHRDYHNYYYDHLDGRTDWEWYAAPRGYVAEKGTYEVTEDKIIFHYSGDPEYGFQKRDETFTLSVFWRMCAIYDLSTRDENMVQTLYDRLKELKQNVHHYDN